MKILGGIVMEFSGRREVVKSLWSRIEQPEYNEEFGSELGVDSSDDAAAQPSRKTDITSIINTIYMSGSGTLR